ASSRNAQPRDRCSAIVTTVNSVFDEHAGINWTTFAHTASQVPVSALGVGGEQFRGIIDNTEIHHKIKKMLE
ncbi:MAG: alkaline phosphatase, partial [Bacteroidales bacterium]|nr:alkaline phosphatase [Bacteroidales bacterium]